MMCRFEIPKQGWLESLYEIPDGVDGEALAELLNDQDEEKLREF